MEPELSSLLGCLMQSRVGWESNHCLPTPISGFQDPTGFDWKPHSPGASAEYGCTPLCLIRLPLPPPPASQMSCLSCPPFLSRCGLDSIWLLPIFKPHHRAKTLPGQVPKGLNQDLLLHTGGALSFREHLSWEPPCRWTNLPSFAYKHLGTQRWPLFCPPCPSWVHEGTSHSDC